MTRASTSGSAGPTGWGASAAIEALFPDERFAAEWLAALRWPQAAWCPRCDGELRVPTATERRWWCGACRQRVSVTSGTVLDHTRVPLRVWLVAAWMMANEEHGVSATTLQRVTGISYGSAWHLLHKLRSALAQDGDDLLAGAVEVDEVLARGSDEALIAIAVECAPVQRVRIALIADRSAGSLRDFLDAHVEEGPRS